MLIECIANIIPIKAGSAIKMFDLDNYNDTDLHGYQRSIGKPMYLVYGTRPNIAFVVGQLSKHNADPKKVHLQATKRLIRYLKRTIQIGLIYRQENSSPRDLPFFGLKSYADSNFANNPKNHKSVMHYFFFLKGAVVS